MGSMITRVDVVPVPALRTDVDEFVPEWALPAVRKPRAQEWPDNRTRLAVRIATDDGVGWFAPVGEAVAALITEQLGPALQGRNALAWRYVGELRLAGRHQRGAHARMALSAVELALWDVRSRLLGRPVTDVLGGARRDRVPVYATALGFDIDHPLASDIARWIVEEGFWAQKWRLPGCARGEPAPADVARLAMLRDAIGEGKRLCVDVAGAWDRGYARRMMPALADYQVEWVEEPAPVPPRWFADAGVAVAGGEHDVDIDDQLRSVCSGDLQVWQPDPAWNGGLVPSLFMIELAASHGLSCCPHGTSLSAVALLGGLHTATAVPAVEYHMTLEPLRQSGIHSPIVPAGGSLSVRQTPGLADFTEVPKTSERTVS